jgi:acylphosphatase
VSRPAIRLIVEGRVQGVGFRWWALGQAVRLGLDGWVRNRRDGRVELVAIGEPADLDRLAQACGKGPPAAFVERLHRFQTPDDGTIGFEQRPTL